MIKASSNVKFQWLFTITFILYILNNRNRIQSLTVCLFRQYKICFETQFIIGVQDSEKTILKHRV